jgi:hypothetical protein
MVFTEILSAFEQNSGVIWITVYCPNVLPSHQDGLQIMKIVRTWCQVIRKEYWNFPISVDFWEQTSCRILIDRASERCGSDVRTSSMFIRKTLRGVRTPLKARPDGCTGTGSIDLIFAQDSLWITSRSLWKCNHYKKCFCFNQNVANKNTNNVLPHGPYTQNLDMEIGCS